MAARPMGLFITGATGFLGHYLLAEWCRRTDARCRVLLRPPLHDSRRRLRLLLAELGSDFDALVEAGRVELVEGELPAEFDPTLLENIDTLIHAAGSTCLESNPSGEPWRTNVKGTEALLEAARAASVHHFVLISTAYVCGRRTGTIAEHVDDNAPAFHNVYEESKWHAEQLALRWAKDERVVTICRPSILFGDRPRGRATNFDGIYLVARAAEVLRRAADDDAALDRHHIPLHILGHSDGTCNLVPVDWVAQRITDILLTSRNHGKVHHLCNPRPPTHARIKRWLEEHFDIGGGVFRESVDPPEPSNRFESLFYSLGNVVSDYFRRKLEFESRASSKDRSMPGLVSRDDFLRSIQYAQACRWGRSRRLLQRPPSCAQEVTPQWYFETFLPERLPSSSVARVQALTTTVCFQVGCKSTCWLCRFEHGRLVEVQAGRNGLIEDFGYHVSSEAFTRIVSAQEPLQTAFFHSEAEITGNVEQALRMVPIMSQFIRECPIHHAGV